MLRFGNFYVPILVSNMNKEEDHMEEINFGIFKKDFRYFEKDCGV